VSSIVAISDGAIYLLRGAIQKDLANMFHKLKDFVLDEPIFRMVAGHISLVTLFSNQSIKTLTLKSRQLTTKYFRTYLLRSFTKSDRRESLIYHYEYLINQMGDIFFRSLWLGSKFFGKRRSMD
jgi:uncharacterized protein VirK/YbjX